MKYCLLCKIAVAPEDEQYCATRQSDGGLVCSVCTEKIRNGHTDALRALSNARQVFG